jgi:type I site-specific restriction-modification system R (restriction) subunit
VPGGYRKRLPEDYDRGLCLVPRDVVDFVLATQPKEWQKLGQHHGVAVKEQFLRRLASEIERRGALDVLRNGLKDSGCKFRLAYFRPASGLNEETRRLHAANLFAVVRQVHFSVNNEKSLDLVLFLNGIPIFTAELKNPLNGQDVEDAIRQYKTDRDPREPLFAYGRCLAHFAVDPDLVYVTAPNQAEEICAAFEPVFGEALKNFLFDQYVRGHRDAEELISVVKKLASPSYSGSNRPTTPARFTRQSGMGPRIASVGARSRTL